MTDALLLCGRAATLVVLVLALTCALACAVRVAGLLVGHGLTPHSWGVRHLRWCVAAYRLVRWLHRGSGTEVAPYPTAEDIEYLDAIWEGRA
jgi:hypothetical protein